MTLAPSPAVALLPWCGGGVGCTLPDVWLVDLRSALTTLRPRTHAAIDLFGGPDPANDRRRISGRRRRSKAMSGMSAMATCIGPISPHRSACWGIGSIGDSCPAGSISDAYSGCSAFAPAVMRSLADTFADEFNCSPASSACSPASPRSKTTLLPASSTPQPGRLFQPLVDRILRMFRS